MPASTDQSTALNVLRRHTFRSIGCTDPVGIGLAAALACALPGGQPRRVHLRLDKNTYKDALGVGVPGAYAAGLDLAVALALLKGRPEAGLELFRDVTPRDVPAARRLLASLQVVFDLEPDSASIYIHARVETSAGVGEVTLRGAHDRVVEQRLDGRLLEPTRLPAAASGLEAPDELDNLRAWSLPRLRAVVESLPLEAIRFLQAGVALNLQAAEAGLAQAPGLGLGRRYQRLAQAGLLPPGLHSRVRMLAAAAADMRMGGAVIPIFGCYGSGNHGITFFITVGETARFLGKSEADTLRALALGLLVIGVAKTRTGILTPHCGCALAAGSGAAAAVAYLLGAADSRIEAAVHLMDANLTGMLCDGAKPGCALKIATSAGAALESAYLALDGDPVGLQADGILGSDFQETMDNLQIITERGMQNLDRAVLDILLKRRG